MADSVQVRKHPFRSGFILSVGDRKRGGYYAENLNEVQRALEHYFMRLEVVHSGVPSCPLCRAMKEEQEWRKL